MNTPKTEPGIANPKRAPRIEPAPAGRKAGVLQQRRIRIGKWLLLAALMTASGRLFSQYTIDWYKVSGGGGASSGGTYSASGTIGQQDAGGPMAGGGYSLTGGFWALYAVQTPGAPALGILITNNAAMVYWPSPSTGWNPQMSTNLLKTNWVTPSQSIIDNGTIKYILVSPPTGSRFFRLIKP